MIPKLLHLYGPFAINSYGVAIALGVLVFMWLAQKSELRKKIVSADDFMEVIMVGIIVGVVGGRVLHVIEHWDQFDSFFQLFQVWEGGLSILGTVLAELIYMPWYLNKKNIPLLPFLDLCALFAPLMQSIARLGCFLAGCCYGCTTNAPWALVYTHPESFAPLNIPLHPTQLYSSLALLMVYALMQFFYRTRYRIAGQLMALYLILAPAQRFVVDIWRGDRTVITSGWIALSFNQLVALALCSMGCLMLFILNRQTTKNA